MLLLMFFPVALSLVNVWLFLPVALLLNLWLCQRAVVFQKQPERATARRLFFGTLMYLPVILIITVAAWR
jgi:heme O synthase-like polyprenyltransferase